LWKGHLWDIVNAKQERAEAKTAFKYQVRGELHGFNDFFARENHLYMATVI